MKEGQTSIKVLGLQSIFQIFTAPWNSSEQQFNSTVKAALVPHHLLLFPQLKILGKLMCWASPRFQLLFCKEHTLGSGNSGSHTYAVWPAR